MVRKQVGEISEAQSSRTSVPQPRQWRGKTSRRDKRSDVRAVTVSPQVRCGGFIVRLINYFSAADIFVRNSISLSQMYR